MLSQFRGRFKGVVKYDAEKDKYSYIVYKRQLRGLIIEGTAIALILSSFCYVVRHRPLGELEYLILCLVLLISLTTAIAVPMTEWDSLKPFKELKTFDSQEEALDYIDKKYLETNTKERFF